LLPDVVLVVLGGAAGGASAVVEVVEVAWLLA
jgi:hypothetical protein